MIEDLGLMQKESGDFAGAVSYFQQARSMYSTAEDILRTILEQVDGLTKSGNKKAALTLIQATTRLVPDSPTTVLLRKLEARLAPSSPTPRNQP
jgi:hypothetical protein